MKKLKNGTKFWKLRRQARLEIKKAKTRIARKLSAQLTHLKKVQGTYIEFRRIKVPQTITIAYEPQRQQLLNFLQILRHSVGIRKENVLIDFSGTEKVYADGTLLLYAEISRLKANYGESVKIRGILPKRSSVMHNQKSKTDREKVAQVLKQVGILDLLSNQAPILPSFDDVIHWRHAHGYKVENEKSESILSVVDKLIGGKVRRRTYTVISEAITNSTHHAYEKIRNDGLGIADNAGWWLFLQVKDDNLSLLACDLGIGIPASLPGHNANWAISLYNNKFRMPESEAIKFATTYGSTSTKRKNRGKGLRMIVKIVEQIKGSSLAIYSNKGKFMAGKYTNINRKEYKDSILGTLIIWNIPIASNKEVIL